MTTRKWLAALMALGCTLAAAQEPFPSRPLTLINPWAAGSSTDVMARTLAEEFRKQLGQSVVVVSRDGGSGVIGMNVLAQAPADGLTLAFTPMTPITVQPHYVKGLKLGPDSVQPLCGVTENILGVSVRADSPFKTIGELVAAAKKGSLSYGSPGPNSAPFLAMDQLERDQGLRLVHVPYKGDAGSIQELLAGRLDFVSSIAASAAPQKRAGMRRRQGVATVP
jgi:tripartite-type tricarboxylate transporter receptor subunit TctC